MKLTIKSLLVALGLFWTVAAWAAGTQYIVQVKGLACPFCAAGIEKQFREIKGVEHVDVELQKGQVTIDVAEGVKLTEPELKKLFKDAGFTYSGVKVKPR